MVEVVEEVIAEHPPPPSKAFQAGSLLAARAPVHMAMTAATIGHFPAMQTLQQSQAQPAAAEYDLEMMSQQQVGHKGTHAMRPNQKHQSQCVSWVHAQTDCTWLYTLDFSDAVS